MSFLEYINEVKVSGIVISAIEREVSDCSTGLLIKLKNRMKTEINGEITEREYSIQIKVSPELYSECFSNVQSGDELMVAGYLVVDTVQLAGRDQPLDYMRVTAISKLAHIPKPTKGFSASSFKQT
ncbi:hypothetical protein L6R44_10880 [Enterobacter cloacae complex sp. ECC445]|uniref:hypothetical protein n=1 Tax=Enterobacter cloacae complex sp. ECC445 TaxID=2913213 RepID=UPI001F46817C|nr:hypothetical protein [Enterobacter cloacae complex sp. ECC445]MCG0456609.1 hypothetical protein [Enterobacter cloacae complex sp. ECC445]MCW1829804.1 hypothetical protein [Enterobacter asburiae]